MGVAAAEQVQTLFDHIAPRYDALNEWLSLGQHRIWKQMTVRWANPKPGGVQVDLCCGSGDLALRMARTLRGQGTVIGIDFSAQQLAIARRRAQQCPWPSALQWVESDVLTLPLADQSVDAATMGYGLRNVTSIPAALAELYRVLKPGAKAALLDFNRLPSGIGQQFQQWYLQQVVVPVAAAYGLREEYAYLEPSLARFPTGVEQEQLAHQAGFTGVCHYPIAAGLMGVLVVTKPKI